MPSFKGRTFRTASFVLLALLLCVTGAGLARAGGGQSYGGGRSGGGGGGGGDGLGVLVYLLVRLCVEQPCIGIPLTAALIIMVVVINKRRRKMQEQYIARAASQRRDAAAVRGAADVRILEAADPAFTGARFEETVKTAFLAVQSAWSVQDMSGVKAFVSDGVRERFGLQFQIQRALGYRNTIDNLAVLGVRVAGASVDAGFQTIHAGIHARADDADVDLATGRRIRTNTRNDFHEYWTFLRRPGAGTPEKGGLVQGFCPNCGASLSVSDAGVCDYCGAWITSGAYDWILTGITQESEWKPLSPPEGIPGFAEMVRKDPGFSIQPLLDTTSVVFWRYVSCYFHGSTDPMVKVASPVFTPVLRNRMDQAVEGDWHLYFHDAAVGSVEVIEIVPGDDVDRVRVLVKWSAWNRWRNPAGQSRGSGDRSIRPQVFTMSRLSAVRTRTETDFHSAHCPGCGAPYTNGASGSCEYCGRPLNDGSGAWVLEDITALGAEMLSRVPGHDSIRNPDLALMAMVATMFADGSPGPEERKLLDGFAASRGVPPEKVDQIIASAGQDGVLPRAQSPGEAKAVLAEMVAVALADGTIYADEMKFLEAYAGRAGLSAADLRSVVSGQRRRLYREARSSRGSN